MILKGQKDRIEKKVNVIKPGDRDQSIKVEFYLICKTATFTQQQELSQSLNAGTVGDVEMVREWSNGWKGLKDADDQDVPYTDETLEIVMDDRDYRKAIVGALLETIFGQRVDHTIKN